MLYVQGIMFPGGYFRSNSSTKILRKTILQLCTELKDNSVSLVDALAPPDFILASPIGRADGQVANLISSFISWIS